MQLKFYYLSNPSQKEYPSTLDQKHNAAPMDQKSFHQKARTQFYKNFFLARFLLHYGTTTTSQYFDFFAQDLLENKKPLIFDVSDLLVKLNIRRKKAVIKLELPHVSEKTVKDIIISAFIYNICINELDECVGNVKCMLSKSTSSSGKQEVYSTKYHSLGSFI